MKFFASSRPIGLIAALLLVAAGCGGGSGGATGNPDASLGEDAQTGEDSAAPEASNGEAGPSCGDGVVDGTEQCDDGVKNGTNGDPCTASCTWVCTADDGGDQACNAGGNVCTGTATCLANHTCQPGTAADAGTTCGAGEICNNGTCAQAVCGDGIVTSPEECDDGSNNGTANDGCTLQCTFVCVSTDPNRDCTPTDPCAGQGTCNDQTHVCTPGTPEGDGTICAGGTADGGLPDAAAGDAGAIEVCKSGTCVPGYCGDGIVEAGEQCDFGAGNGAGTGCELTCQYSCAPGTAGSCTTVDLCSGTNACTSVVVSGDTGYKCVTGTPPADGTPCGSGDAGAGTCQGGVCKTALCGDGILESGEQCDFGTGNNVTGSGCNPDCQFSCQTTPSDTCPNNNLCAASPTTCQADTGPNSTKGQKCQPATTVPQCGSCAADGICVGGTCATPTCGDGCSDPDAGIQCSPPSTATCSSTCTNIICGDGKREAPEECDDGNTVNLDGCDSTCKFEQVQRANTVAIKYASDSFCGNDVLGEAIQSPVAQSVLSGDLTDSVKAGTTTISFKFMSITDLTGTSQTSGLALGALSGTPAAAPSGVTYSGASDLDWWYTTDPTTIDASRNPTSQVSAAFAAKVLSATNGSFDLTISIAGSPAKLAISAAHVQASVGAVSTPTASTGQTPGHLASEHLDPALQSFASMSNGLLCGNISAASMAAVPIPTALTSGVAACQNITYVAANPDAGVVGNSLLDVFIGGCTGNVIAGKIIVAAQPDQLAAGVATATVIKFTEDSVTHKVNACTVNGLPGVLATCLADTGYSSYFGFTTDRIIAK